MRLALVVILGALALALVPSAVAADGTSPADLEAELVCPTCKTTLDQSDAPVARRMKEIIRERIAAGDSADEIKASLVEQFGPAVLATPPKEGFDLLAWVLPLALLAAGAVIVGLLAWAWSRGRPPGQAEPAAEALDPEVERRIDDELARLDA